MTADFNINVNDVVQEPVLYGDFVAQSGDRAYQEIDDLALVNNNMFCSCDFCFQLRFFCFFR